MIKRSYLFVPGDRPDRFQKAVDSGAHAAILDLDDAVAPEHKEAARESVASWLSPARSVYVRINRTTSPWYLDDIEMIAARQGVLGVMVPEAETAAQLGDVAARLADAMEILALVESAVGIWNALELARLPRVTRLAFGSLDLKRDTGIEDDGDGLLYSRSRVVLASRCAGIDAPIEGVTTALDDSEQLTADVARARALGFGAKQCIHPKQVAAVNAGFMPREHELRWARGVLEAVERHGQGAIRFEGQMIDRPVIERARQIIAAAASAGAG